MTNNIEIFCREQCDLGEGPLWHPERGQLFWFDINAHLLLTKKNRGEKPLRQKFDLPVSAASIIDKDHLLIAKADGLYCYHIDSGKSRLLQTLEAEIGDNRSNDGRTAPDGSFWIGTMSYRKEVGRRNGGKIYCYRRGKISTLIPAVGIPNSICFDVEGDLVRCYWSDSLDKRIYYLEVPLEELSQLEAIDPSRIKVLVESISGNPDGSVVDSEHQLWNAEWGSGKVVCYNSRGKVVEEVKLPISQPTCPAFISIQEDQEDLDHLVVTSAYNGLNAMERKKEPMAGMTLIFKTYVIGRKEYRGIF